MKNLTQPLIQVNFPNLRNDDWASLWVIQPFVFHHVYYLCDKSLHMLLRGQKHIIYHVNDNQPEIMLVVFL